MIIQTSDCIAIPIIGTPEKNLSEYLQGNRERKCINKQIIINEFAQFDYAIKDRNTYDALKKYSSSINSIVLPQAIKENDFSKIVNIVNVLSKEFNIKLEYIVYVPLDIEKENTILMQLGDFYQNYISIFIRTDYANPLDIIDFIDLMEDIEDIKNVFYISVLINKENEKDEFFLNKYIYPFYMKQVKEFIVNKAFHKNDIYNIKEQYIKYKIKLTEVH